MLGAKAQSVIRRLAENMLAASSHSEEREAITATGGVPVRASWTGFTMVTVDGTVLFYSTETRSVETVLDKQAMRGALKKLSELDPALRSLAPARPRSAHGCELCGGVGKVTRAQIELECGECDGLGWRE